MSIMSSLRRQVYGIPPRGDRTEKLKYFQRERARRGAILRSAAETRAKETAKKEAQKVRRTR